MGPPYIPECPGWLHNQELLIGFYTSAAEGETMALRDARGWKTGDAGHAEQSVTTPCEYILLCRKAAKLLLTMNYRSSGDGPMDKGLATTTRI